MQQRWIDQAACLLAASFLVVALPCAARADIVLSSNDGHTVQDEQKKLVAPKEVHPDTISLIDVSRYPPTIKATIDVPGSVVGPPTAAWMAKDESWAIVTSATKADPQSKEGIGPDDRVSVIDLTSNPPKIVQSLTAGAGATTVRLARWQVGAGRKPHGGHGLGVHRGRQAADGGGQGRSRQQGIAAERYRLHA